MTFSTSVNGEKRDLDLSGHEAAVDVIREQLGLTGTKLVCAGGVCGACTIQIDGVPAAGCLTPATAMVDAEVTTVEGIADGDELHPVQKAFLAHDGLQCGYCTPGFIVDGAAFYDGWRAEHGDSAPRPEPARPRSPTPWPATSAAAPPMRASTARSYRWQTCWETESIRPGTTSCPTGRSWWPSISRRR